MRAKTFVLAVAQVCSTSLVLAGVVASSREQGVWDPVKQRTFNSEAGFLPNWMGKLVPIIGGDTLLDISVPGTHDTLTSDLSTRFADNWGEEFPSWANWLLSTFGDIPLVGNFARLQSKTQGALITQQLDAGVRFLDFRTILRCVFEVEPSRPWT